jgi:hypothetical protein
MIRNNASIRRLLAARLKTLNSLRSYHVSAVVGADALDMTDTFARRHSEFSFFVVEFWALFADVIMTSAWIFCKKRLFLSSRPRVGSLLRYMSFADVFILKS